MSQTKASAGCSSILVLDGVYVGTSRGGPRFVPVPAPTASGLQHLVARIGERIGRHLERLGLRIQDSENAHLHWDGEKAAAQQSRRAQL